MDWLEALLPALAATTQLVWLVPLLPLLAAAAIVAGLLLRRFNGDAGEPLIATSNGKPDSRATNSNALATERRLPMP